jgi:hypothetical protein
MPGAHIYAHLLEEARYSTGDETGYANSPWRRDGGARDRRFLVTSP